jgi:hypothetical protein
MPDIIDRRMYERISIDVLGTKVTVTQSADSLSKALEQELDYKENNGPSLAMVIITERENFFS